MEFEWSWLSGKLSASLSLFTNAWKTRCESKTDDKTSGQNSRMEAGLVQSVPPDFNGDLFKDSWLYSNVRTRSRLWFAAANGFRS